MAIAMAKAEATQARAAHSKKEIELTYKQACIQASVDALNDEKEKDAAIAEANTLVAGLQDMGFEIRSEASSPVPGSIKDQHTATFVAEQASLHIKHPSVIRESDNAPPTFHFSHLQPTEVIPSTPHPLNASQSQAAASAAVLPLSSGPTNK